MQTRHIRIQNNSDSFLTGRLHFILLTATGVLILSAAGLAAANRAIWYDELFSFYVANLPSPTQILDALLQTVDNNPPIDYLIRYVSMQIGGTSILAFRLPSVVLFLCGCIFLYRFVAPNVSRTAALATFCFPILTLSLRYSHEGRAYALLFASAALALYAWQRCIASSYKIPFLLLLYLSLTVGCFSHLYGVFTLVPIVAGEAYRLKRLRHITWPILLVLIAVSLTCLLLYPFIVNASQFSAHFWTKTNIFELFKTYESLLPNIVFPVITAIVLLIIASLLLPIIPFQSASQNTNASSKKGVPHHELVAVVIFCLIPVFQYVAAELVTNAFTPRYAIVTVAGFAILTGYACHQAGHMKPLFTLICSACILGFSLFHLAHLAMYYSDSRHGIDDQLETFIEKAQLPVVFSNSHSYLYHYFYLPEQLASRIIYLVDAEQSIRYIGSDTDQIGLKQLQKAVPLRLLPYAAFWENESEFYVIAKDFSSGWPMRKLKQDFQEGRIRLTIEQLLSSGMIILKIEKLDIKKS